MKMKNIRTKMLVFILPVVILAMFLLTLVSVASSRKIIYNQIAKEMKSELTAQNQTILNKLENVSETARSLSFMVGTTYQDLDLPNRTRQDFQPSISTFQASSHFLWKVR